MTEEAAPPLELRGISKSFGGVAALRDVDFVLRAGEIHGLVGENGAGKSTLMKIIAGLHGQYDGRMVIDGRPVHFRSPREALAAGHRHGPPGAERRAGPHRGRERLSRPAADEGRHRRLARHGRWRAPAPRRPRHRRRSAGAHGVAGDRPAAADRARPRAVLGRRIVILDEPTSALSPPEVQRLFEVLRGVRASGRSIVFISHFLDDV
jgi:ribose transport system ATP-binding protein